MIANHPLFSEAGGGFVYGQHTGKAHILQVNVTDLNTADAAKVMRVTLDALNTAYGAQPTPTAEPAPTFTAADLARAWEAGRDAAMVEVQEVRDIPSTTLHAEAFDTCCDLLTGYISALTPPADLAELLKGGAQ
jgi:hypothetical protein